MELVKGVMQDDRRRAAFDGLAGETFGISFGQWYRDGYWTDRNVPYTLFDGERAVANVSVNRMEVLWQGEIRRYVQLGTVMTAEAYRGQGLSTRLMDEVWRDWGERCDAMFLFANASVLDFYPRFGFERAVQYEFGTVVSKNGDVLFVKKENIFAGNRLLFPEISHT